MRKHVFASLALAIAWGAVWGGATAAGLSADKNKLTFDELDMQRVAQEDAITDNKGVAAYRFAVGHEVKINPAAHGVWETRSNGELAWRFEVETPDAAHLNFGFRPFHLPPGASLVIRAKDGTSKLAPLTSANNLSSGQWWTEVLLSNSAVLELTVPANVRDQVQLELVKVGQGYRGFGATAKHCKSGACNMDVACLANGDPWQNPRRSVGAYTVNGTDTCTGSLLNNTANDRRMIFATAGHCGVSSDSVAATVVSYWNYESATCRAPGSPESGTPVARPTTTSNGARFLARTGSTSTADFTLIEFLQAANPAHNLYWAGWDRRDQGQTCAATGGTTSTAGLCASIHHPGVDEKRITFVEVNMPITGYNTQTGTTHLHANWDPTPPILPGIQPAPGAVVPGVTEPGSSGSPLYESNQRLVGVLSGGPSACGSTGANLSDYYGRLAVAWEGGGTTTTGMKTHLDPVGGGTANTVDGLAQCTQPAAPTDIQVAAGGDNTINVSWTGVASITKYRILRSMGACPGTGYTQIAEVDNATSYSDTTVSGGSTYSYKVVSVDTAQPCESVQSSCSSATASGACTLAPTFTGAMTANSAGTAACGVNVNWSAASANCGAGGQIRYNVFRSTTPGFTPSADNAVATCVSGTSFADTGLAPATQYHYIVRSEDSTGTGGGLCGSGLQDTNTIERAVTPAGPDTNAFADDGEAGPAPWTVAGTGSVGANFSQVTTQANSGTYSWFVPDPANVSERTLTTTAPIAVPSAPGTTLEFYIRYATEARYDGTLLEYSLDGGTTWTDILGAQGSVPANANRFLSGGYNAAMQSGGVFGARTAWHGDFNTAWIRSRVDLSAFANTNALFRFRFASDTSVASTGFWVDDVRVFYGSTCTSTLPEVIFANGFEP
ncbi:fibronectin type III domain-containing protein [Tahibacter amnicola]|uniref:Immune inhibitor A n=1 Tax=Tahibacter amnicola TaxID=2976241 RepID=A0ABY6B9L4_9GAMM|nr:immune inhibitor A domain-containing protein [Tahibacter amnicola]UXI66369.1 immune inhibitor A [Tahibacter amnicola]